MVRESNSKQNTDKKMSTFRVGLCIAGVILLAAYFRVAEVSALNFFYDVEVHLLGKLAVLLPILFIYFGLKGLFASSAVIPYRVTIGSGLLVLCLLGTAHNIFVPAEDTLTPHYLPLGGGLLGGIISLALSKLGNIGHVIALIFCFIMATLLLVPFKFIRSAVKNVISPFTTRKTLESVSNAEEISSQRRKSISLKSDATERTLLDDVYSNSKFDSFHDGLKKKGTFRSILYGSGGIYDKPEIKQDLEKAPVTLPVWSQSDSKGNEHIKETVTAREITSASEYAADFHQENILELDAENREADSELVSLSVNEKYDEPVIKMIEEEPETEMMNDTESAEEKNVVHGGYLLPPLELLNIVAPSKADADKKGIMEQCSVLEQTLADFRVNAKVVAVTRGPSVTRFELQPAPGVKVASVVNLADDIALRLAAPGVRIEAPIPGKSAIGIEAPNIINDQVSFRQVVEDAAVRNNESKLCIGLGKDISGKIISADLAKMPHLLVAGSTGSGKSVCINTIIAGILFKARPDEVKLILVDPKVVELTNYNGIPHLLTPVVTEPKKAASALHWAVVEMERRYQVFADSHVREIKSYNEVAEEKLPYIVIIIDELSDLMMVAKVDVEDAILRLAQKARAAGIHLIIATQRPSVDVITGIVKANIPSRIAFAVSSQTDSRTILDTGGAEKLLGKGDMLFYPMGYNKPLRVQGAFVSDTELNKTVDFIISQSIPVDYKEEVTQQTLEVDAKKKGEDDSGDPYNDIEDELLEEAIALVLDMGQASASMLQRRFRIGYNRAARMVDKLEEIGIIGPSSGSKPREVIMPRKEVEEKFLHQD